MYLVHSYASYRGSQKGGGVNMFDSRGAPGGLRSMPRAIGRRAETSLSRISCLEPKWWNKDGCCTPTAAAISRVVVAAYPFRRTDWRPHGGSGAGSRSAPPRGRTHS
ncbi:hypothetical protein GCM10011574_60200 [Microbispora bryophytorum]|uniref:Uncharacterized protein n=1 Tax=Microbispora bryophytorum TaxID=1460882 RepID=A0A8H9H9D2_9ACTN|nr:hypothetical protein GCM10011574_60200 [Microbispora bryophytorum]